MHHTNTVIPAEPDRSDTSGTSNSDADVAVFDVEVTDDVLSQLQYEDSEHSTEDSVASAGIAGSFPDDQQQNIVSARPEVRDQPMTDANGLMGTARQNSMAQISTATATQAEMPVIDSLRMQNQNFVNSMLNKNTMRGLKGAAAKFQNFLD